MALEIEGKIVKIFPQRSGEGNNGTWTSQDFMIEVPGNYPTKAAFDDFNNAAGLQSFQVGDMVKVSFNIRSNEWQGKYIENRKARRQRRHTATRPLKRNCTVLIRKCLTF